MTQDVEVESVVTTRRHVLCGLAGTAGLAWIGTAAAQTCYVPGKLASGDRGMRQALNFKVVGPDIKRRCGGCAFFTASTSASCGTCKMLSNGPVDAASVCDSWTAKG